MIITIRVIRNYVQAINSQALGRCPCAAALVLEPGATGGRPTRRPAAESWLEQRVGLAAVPGRRAVTLSPQRCLAQHLAFGDQEERPIPLQDNRAG